MLQSETDKVAVEAASGLMSLDPTKNSAPPLLHPPPNSTKSDSQSLAHSPPPLVLPALVAAAASASDMKSTENGSVAECGVDCQRMDRDHKKRAKNWTRQEVLKLIKLRTEYDARFSMNGRKMEVWDEIAQKMQIDCIFRDAQQCRDKWEKLSAGYKEARDGLKDRKENPFFDELHVLLAEKAMKKERSWDESGWTKEKGVSSKDWGAEAAPDLLAKEIKRESFYMKGASGEGKGFAGRGPVCKKSKSWKHTAATDVAAVQRLLESVVSKQQSFFKDLVGSMERRQEWREQVREEMEERWRAAERVQLTVFNNAMLLLIQQLVGGPVQNPGSAPAALRPSSPERTQAPKKRSKNWKRNEVLQLIKAREELESRFAASTRRTGLWEEVAEMLIARGIKRDGKQCREKWDKLMSTYKDVGDGKRERGSGPHFTELTAIVGSRPAE